MKNNNPIQELGFMLTGDFSSEEIAEFMYENEIDIKVDYDEMRKLFPNNWATLSMVYGYLHRKYYD